MVCSNLEALHKHINKGPFVAMLFVNLRSCLQILQEMAVTFLLMDFMLLADAFRLGRLTKLDSLCSFGSMSIRDAANFLSVLQSFALAKAAFVLFVVWVLLNVWSRCHCHVRSR